MTDTIQKVSRKAGLSAAIGRMLLAASVMGGEMLLDEPQSRGAIRAEQVKVKPRKDGRFPYLSNHPCGSRAARRNRRQRGL